MYLPTIRQLQYLVAVVELRHFGHAAERCFVTQSTLSSGIQELEEGLGARLLERTKRKVIPTPLGLAVAGQAEKILGLAVEMVATAGEEKPPLSGPLKLGVIPTIGPFLLPKVLPRVRRAYPQLELYLIEAQTADLLDRLNSGEIDAALLATPYELGKLEYAPIKTERFWVALPAGHPLAQGGPIRSRALPPDELLLLEEGHCLRDHALSACHLGSLQQRAAFQGTSLYTLMEMVAGGQGITFLPEMAIGSAIARQRRVRLRALDDVGPHREIGLAWRSSSYLKKDLQLLAGLVRDISP